jgi:uncharacterized protein (TIGR02300 family)
MPKPELGLKHECDECGARFYDLGRPEAACPKCGTVSLLAVGAIPEKRRRRRGEQVAAEKVVAKPVKPETAEEEDEEEDDIEELDLDEKQAERHLDETASSDDDDSEDIEGELSEVEDLDDSIPEVEGVGEDENVDAAASDGDDDA